MVPSTGFITARYAVATASEKASAISVASAISQPFKRFEMPRNSWDKITPELPRAPRRDAAATTSITSPTVAGVRPESSLTAAVTVIDMLEPVSPSGTGNTFKSFKTDLLFTSLLAAEIKVLQSSAASIVYFKIDTSELIHADSFHVDGNAADAEAGHAFNTVTDTVDDTV